jgi:hypothetical protein
VFASSTPRATVARRGLATLSCWYAALIGAVAVLVSRLPGKQPDAVCDGFGCTPDPRGDALVLAIFYGIPLLLAGVVASALGLAVLVKARIRSGVAAGTLAAFGGVAVMVSIPAAAIAW